MRIFHTSLCWWSFTKVWVPVNLLMFPSPSWLGLYNTPTASRQRGKTPPDYDTKQFDGEIPVMLEFWEMRRTPSLPSLQGPHWLAVVATDRVLSMSQIELNCELILKWIVWNRTVYMYINGFGIKNPTMVDMPLNQNKQTNKQIWLPDSSYSLWFNNIVVWMVSARPLISKSSYLLRKHGETIISITTTFIFCSFF